MRIRNREWVGDYDIVGMDHCQPEFYSFRFQEAEATGATTDEVRAG